jgi:ubiquinone biosynthesis protein Coq4
MPSPAPTLLRRTRVVLRHAARVLFLRWPGYTFDDLAALQDSLDGPSFENAARMMAADADGALLLHSRRPLGCYNTDWTWLSRLPIDTFGYNVWHHFYSLGILEDIELGPPVVRWSDEAEYAKARYRATHDIRHVLLGLGIEAHEEVVLQTFQFAQLPQILSALIVVFGGLKHMLIDGQWRALLRGLPLAWRVGRQGRFLLNMPAEDLFTVPLEELRAQWGIEALGDRYPVQQRHPDAAHYVHVEGQIGMGARALRATAA